MTDVRRCVVMLVTNVPHGVGLCLFHAEGKHRYPLGEVRWSKTAEEVRKGFEETEARRFNHDCRGLRDQDESPGLVDSYVAASTAYRAPVVPDYCSSRDAAAPFGKLGAGRHEPFGEPVVLSRRGCGPVEHGTADP